MKSIKKKVWKEWKVLTSFGLLALALVSSFFVSVSTWFCIGGAISVLAMNVYLVCVLFIAAIQSDVKKGSLDRNTYKNRGDRWLPVRTAGLLMVGLFFLADVFSFTAFYQVAGSSFGHGDSTVSLDWLNSLYE